MTFILLCFGDKLIWFTFFVDVFEKVTEPRFNDDF